MALMHKFYAKCMGVQGYNNAKKADYCASPTHNILKDTTENYCHFQNSFKISYNGIILIQVKLFSNFSVPIVRNELRNQDENLHRPPGKK